MTVKTILVYPDKGFEPVESSQSMVDTYNRTVPYHLRITLKDQDDLNEMFIEAGLLVELEIH